ncbi:MAG: hypothetical protein V3V16_13955 [Melioribacteraceae bacterium]
MKKSSILTFILILFSVGVVYPCSCLNTRIKEGFKRSDLIFTGKVVDEKWESTTEKISGTDKTEEYKRVTYTFHITEFIKGTESIKEVKITTSGMGESCGMTFNMGSEYLIYSYETEHRATPNLYLISEKVKPFYTTDLCTRTNELKNIKPKELKKLKRLAKRKK